MKKNGFIFCLGLFLFGDFSLWKMEAVGENLPKEKSCQSVGRILVSEDSKIASNTQMCKDGQLRVSEGGRVLYSCTTKNSSGWLKSGAYHINKLCPSNVVNHIHCHFQPTCWRSKYPLALLSPSSSATLNLTPTVSWSEVQGADSYKLIVKSDTGRQLRTETVAASYSLSDFSLAHGEVYQVLIFAMKSGETIETGTFSVRVPSKAEVNDIEKAIAAARSNSMPQSERIKIINSIYMVHGLSEMSISYLEDQKNKNNLPIVARLLADRYAETGRSTKAIDNYQIVVKTAPKSSDDFLHATKMISFAIENGIE